jgi:hypothetical protein
VLLRCEPADCESGLAAQRSGGGGWEEEDGDERVCIVPVPRAGTKNRSDKGIGSRPSDWQEGTVGEERGEEGSIGRVRTTRLLMELGG